jgi:hypothetical protein
MLAPVSSLIEFALVPWVFEGAPRGLGVVPVIDGRSLIDLVSAFEQSHGYDFPGSYCGVDADSVRHGFEQGADDLGYYQGLGRVEVLSDDESFEGGAWPLTTIISADAAGVTWANFKQPRRPRQSYTQFGPFEFDRAAFGSATTELKARLAAE